MIKPSAAGFEACIAGLGATLRCAYGTEDDAVDAGRRLGDQLMQCGWIRCEVVTAGAQADDMPATKDQTPS